MAPHPVSADVALRRTLDQHWELHQLLDVGVAHARATLGGDFAARKRLGLLVRLACRKFVEHLQFEEAMIVPLLRDDLPVGPLRAERLLDEHARQVEEIEALCAWGDVDDPRELASRFIDLSATLLADMDHEERELLTSDVIRDDGVVIDQCAG
jgi:hypothetical protein